MCTPKVTNQTPSDPTKWMSTRKWLSIIIIKNQLQNQHYEESITKMVLPKNGYKRAIMKSCYNQNG